MTDERTMVRLLGEALQALDEGGERALGEFLAARPAEAGELRQRLQRLQHMGLLAASRGEESPVPARLGGFLLREKLGDGGMGVVYLAEQPSLRRVVALKLIRPGHLYFPDARRRFEREVQTIARLEHPRIVRVYESGEDQGIPFFTMERIEGVSLAQVMVRLHQRGQSQPGEQDVLEVLRELGAPADAAFEFQARSWVERCFHWARDLAEALAYAHARGVLHRDVKPSNVMLTWSGRVMLLDFGLASTQDASRITDSGMPLGSLPYMSPEQLRGDAAAIDARTDVYSLGVMLYELLALRHPFFEKGQNVEQARRHILERPVPSLRRTTSGVPWDAETVCLAAMEREPARRYQSAADLARDLSNVLQWRTIEARRPGAGLRLRRLVQRHPAWAVGVVLGFFLFVAGPVSFGLFQRHKREQLREARDAAELEASVSRATLDFLNDDLLSAAAPDRMGEDASLRQVLDAASARVEGRFADQPLVEARIRSTIGHTYRLIGSYEQGRFHLARALELMRRHLGARAPETLEVAGRLASADWRLKDYARAEPLWLEILPIQREVLGPDHEQTLNSQNNLGLLYREMGRHAEAEPLLIDTLARRTAVLGEGHKDTLVSMSNLAYLRQSQGRFEEAEDVYRRTVERSMQSLGEQHPSTLNSMYNLAMVLGVETRMQEADAWMTRVLEGADEVLGPEHPETLNYMVNHADLFLNSDLRRCEELLDRVEERCRGLGKDTRESVRASISRGRLLGRQGHHQEALDVIGPALDACYELFGEDHPTSAGARYFYATVLTGDHQWEEALDLSLESLDYTASVGWMRFNTLICAGTCLTHLERYDEAADTLVEAETLAREQDMGRSAFVELQREWIVLLRAQGHTDEAERWRAMTAEQWSPAAADSPHGQRP